ncbi:MAG: PadR family transcriptional regulator [Pseudomonadota bacterium]
MARTSRTRFAVLGSLTLGDRSGYDLKQEIERRMGAFWAESIGQIYPTLKQLELGGLVEEVAPSDEAKRSRRVYRITDAGLAELKDWLRAPPQPEQVRNEILLKLYFGPHMGAETALGHVARFEAYQRALLELFEQFKPELVAAADSEEQRLFWEITLSSGLHIADARIAWCEETRRRLLEWQQAQGRDPDTAGD